MKLCSSERPPGAALCFLFVSLSLTAANAEVIRLRNETIFTQQPQAAAAAVSPAPETSAIAPGDYTKLVLLQFRTSPDEAIRQRLKTAGVSLLRFVPDNAFVARLDGVTLPEVRQLPFVTWAGPYHSHYKVHPALYAQAAPAANAPAPVSSGAAEPEVTVLLAAGTRSGEVAFLKRLLKRVDQESSLRFGTVLRGALRPGELEALANSEAVLWVEPAPKMKLFDEVSAKLVAGDGGANELFSRVLGYDGEGVTVAVADSGLHNGDTDSMHPDLLGRVIAFFQYGNLLDAADEHSHGTHVAGIIAGNGATGELDENGALYGLGVAPGASIVAQRIFDGVGGYEAPPSFEKLTRDATRAGAVIGSNSWGDDTQGRYDISAMEFDELVRDADALMLGNQEYILEFSAGNAGPGTRTIGSPAVAKNVIATGASGNDRPDFFIYADGPDAMAEFSSRGPCEDGRIKPDVVAPGTWIASLQSFSASDMYAWYPISPNYQYQGGTSQAGPHVTGAAAVFVQFYRENFAATPSPALVKAALINSAFDLEDSFGTTPTPNMDEGWGSVDLTALVDPELRLLFTDQDHLLSTGQVYEQRLVTISSEEPLKITLAYTDVPGFPGALPALVNDLDLELTAPGGVIYRGNQFQEGRSIPDAVTGDRVNNVEGVYLPAPAVGEYIIRVRAVRVPEDARSDTAGVNQDFALVCSGPLARPGDSVLAADRRSYRAPDVVTLTVVDTDATGAISVRATSATEPGGELVPLTAAGMGGVFTGAVATATGPASADGRLQVAHGETVTFSYLDVSQNQQRTTSARIDLLAPVLSNVRTTNVFGRVVILWNSDELADSTVVFGSSPATVTNLIRASDLNTAHALSLVGLQSDTTYWFYVASRDEAGNASTNSNNGALFSFVVAPNRPVLLIDEYLDVFFDVPPLSGYTDALNAAGVSYDIWSVADQGEPPLEVLKAYRALFWRVPELTGVWSASERAAIRTYMAEGGALFVASMEVLSRVEATGDLDFITNVLQVQSYTVDPESTGAWFVYGSEFSPVGEGLAPQMDYTPYEIIWGGLLGPDISDTIVPAPGAVPMLLNDTDDIVGLHWVGTNAARLVFLSFPLDAVALAPGVEDRAVLVRRVADFLLPDLGGGSLWLNSPNFTLPSRVDVELASAELAGERTVQVTAQSSTDSDGISVSLYETGRRGFFEGYFELQAPTNTPSTGKLLAKHGDVIEVFAEVQENFLTARATVDTAAPGIDNVGAEPDYIDAVVSWTTTEPTDALVQFGESALLGRTAYSYGPGIAHNIVLAGLSPDRTYYYRVVSRDIAGNAITDDNQGRLYTLRTLAPLLTPWSDDMNSGATNWTVIDAEESQPGWQLGVPQGGFVSAAHSPPLAWGTSLSGQAQDFVETFLVSPAVFLTNGNVATLTFWHAYDFPDLTGFDIEFAELLLIANNGPAVTLAQYGDSSWDWVQEEVDLTRYMGQMVYLAWHYLLFSLEAVPRPGWLIDDVSINVQSVSPGTIEISNSISAATFVLSGPLYRKGSGASLQITNAPPGDYVLEFGDVPNYATPQTQQRTLSPGGKIQFYGEYLPTTAEIDSDGDGMSDAAEVIAGTDPTNPTSVLRVTTAHTTGALSLTCPTVSGRSYRVVSTTDGVQWQVDSDWVSAAPSGMFETSVPAQATAGGRLYRIEVRRD